MLVLAIFATIASFVWTGFVIFANGMSDAPTAPFQGGGGIALAWLFTLVLWIGYVVG